MQVVLSVIEDASTGRPNRRLRVQGLGFVVFIGFRVHSVGFTGFLGFLGFRVYSVAGFVAGFRVYGA